MHFNYLFLASHVSISHQKLSNNLIDVDLAMLLVELIFILKEVEFPAWLFPYTTAHEFINTIHRLFPAFMNGCRCITGAFYQDRKALREKALDELVSQSADMSFKASQLSHSMEELMYKISEGDEEKEKLLPEKGEEEDSSVGLIESILLKKAKEYALSKDGREGIRKQQMEKSLKLIEDPYALAKAMNLKSEDSSNWTLLRNLCIYFVIRFVFFQKAN